MVSREMIDAITGAYRHREIVHERYKFRYPSSLVSRLGYTTEWLLRRYLSSGENVMRWAEATTLECLPRYSLKGYEFVDLGRYVNGDMGYKEFEGDPDIEVALAFGDVYSYRNYFHFVLAILSCYKEFCSLRESVPGIKLCCLGEHNKKYHYEWFDILGIDRRSIVSISRMQDSIRVRALLTVKSSSVKHRRLASEAILSKLYATDAPEVAKKIFVNREPGSVRSLVNNNVIADIACASGYKEVLLEGMPVIEQIGCFASSSRVLLLHGASIINSCFMSRDSCLIEFSGNHLIMAGLDLSISNYRDYGYILNAQESSSQCEKRWKPVMSPFYLDPSLFEEAINIAETQIPR